MAQGKSKKNATTIITARIPVALKKQLDGLAKLRACPSNTLVLQALVTYLQEDRAYLASVEAGLRDADAGRFVPHSAVKQWLQSWGSEQELPPPRCK